MVRIEHAHIPIQTMLAARRGAPGAGRAGDGGAAASATSRARATRCRPACGGVGYDVTLLDDGALTAAQLARFDAIVVGVRAFNTSERLRAAHDRLMAYVEAGGTLVVQYNTNNRLAPLSTPLGPFPLEIGRDRVTDETAPMTPVRPEAPAAAPAPTGSRPRDFDGWVQERGLYFAENWDDALPSPCSRCTTRARRRCAGGLLVARHGKGTFVYTGLAFFRQLPAGVPGAYRLFANLLAHGDAEHLNGDGRAAGPRPSWTTRRPLLGTWRNVYLLVLGTLAVRRRSFWALTRAYS